MSKIRSLRAVTVSLLLGVGFAGCGGSTAAPSPPATTAVVAQQDHGADTAEAEHHRHRHHGGVTMLVAMSIRDLDLSPEQKASVEKLRTDLLAKMDPARTAGKNLANLLADGVAAGVVDRAKADAAIAQLGTAIAGLHDATTDAMNQLHNTLTAQQRAALVDKLQAHWDKWKDAQGHDEQAAKPEGHRGGHLEELTRELSLTPDQVDKIKASFMAQMKAGPQTDDHKEVQGHMQAFATAFKADTFDAKTLGTENGANTHMATWGATRMARFFEAVAPVLTPDQRTKLAQEIREHASHEPT
jgi:Spy/CpxP family protein refolding chaperone